MCHRTAPMEFTAEDGLVLEFLRRFAWLEYRMKEGDYLTGDGRGARANWPRLAAFLDKSCPQQIKDLAKQEGVAYLLAHPPRKQVVREGELCWEPLRKRARGGDWAWLIDILRTTRNNLFHGAKFDDGRIADPSRDPQLLVGGLEVLEAIRGTGALDGR